MIAILIVCLKTQNFYLFFLILFFKLYIIVLVLPNIKMNPPQVYMCSPSWTLLPPPSPFHLLWTLGEGRGGKIWENGIETCKISCKKHKIFKWTLGRLQSMGSLRVRYDWATSPSLFTFMHWRRKWQPTPVFSPGESQGRGSMVGCRLWGRTESDMTEMT